MSGVEVGGGTELNAAKGYTVKANDNGRRVDRIGAKKTTEGEGIV